MKPWHIFLAGLGMIGTLGAVSAILMATPLILGAAAAYVIWRNNRPGTMKDALISVRDANQRLLDSSKK
jgi:hypothetical protein